LFHYLGKDSLQIVEKCFTCENKTPQIKLMHCQKQHGEMDCGVYAIVFTVALAFGSNPKQTEF